MTTKEAILHLGAALASHRGIAISTLGREMMGHGHFFRRLQEGRTTIGCAERALDRLSDRWPADLDWPSDIPRPDPSPSRKDAA